MSLLDIVKTYGTGRTPTEADLDNLIDSYQSFVNTTKINDDNIQDSTLVGSSKLIDNSVTATELADNSITTAKINDSAVTTAKINDSAVTTAKVTNNIITRAKLSSANYAEYYADGGTNITSSYPTYTDTDYSVNLTTSGRPVMVMITGGYIYESYVSFNFTNTFPNVNRLGNIGIYRNSIQISQFDVGHDEFFTIDHVTLPIPFFPIAYIYIDNPSAGTYTYNLKGTTLTSATTMTLYRLGLKVIEL